MMIHLKESLAIVECTEICCYTEDRIELAKETYLAVDLLNEPLQLLHCVKTALEHVGILFGNDLDTVAGRFNSSVELVTNDIYKIVDLLNCSTEDLKNGTTVTMYFKRIPNSGIRGGLYRQLICDDISIAITD